MSDRLHPAGVEFRSARVEEYPQIARVTIQGFENGPYGKATDPERIALLNDCAGRAAAGDLLVAVNGDEVVGTATLLRPGSPYGRQGQADESELRLVAVMPAARGRGVAAGLVELALQRSRDYAEEWGVKALVLDAGERNVAAHRLYERCGFTRHRERERIFLPGLGQLLVYRCAL